MPRFAALFLLPLSAFAQSPDATPTPTLLNEIHARRQDIEATTVTSQRVQIALYRLQSQTSLVTVAQQRLDAARTRTASVRNEVKNLASEMQRQEEQTRTVTNPDQKKDIELHVTRIKSMVESLTAQEGIQRAAEADAESQL